jgi:DNA-binding transcriptional regulator YbjK
VRAAAPGSSDTVRATRRHDPDRASRIVEATIGVLAEHGVAGTTSRRIAAAADVPLGSLTYHFTGLEDLLAQAFTRHAERMAAGYEARFADVASTEDVIEAVTDLVHADADGDERDWAVAYELFLAALRDPALRTVTEAWMRRSRSVLERFVDPITSRGIDALIEGLVMHKVLATSPVSRAQTREIIARAVRPTRSREPAR